MPKYAFIEVGELGEEDAERVANHLVIRLWYTRNYKAHILFMEDGEFGAATLKYVLRWDDVSHTRYGTRNVRAANYVHLTPPRGLSAAEKAMWCKQTLIDQCDKCFIVVADPDLECEVEQIIAYTSRRGKRATLVNLTGEDLQLGMYME